MPSTITGSGVDKFDGTTIAGHVIQVANYTTGTMATGTTTTPLDNTIPQITEGTQFMSLAFIPKKANSKLKIDVVIYTSHSTAGAWFVNALFRDSGVNAIGIGAISQPTATAMISCAFTVYVDAISTSLSTFTVRSGGQAGTLTFNGQSGGVLFGGSLASSITITEIAQ